MTVQASAVLSLTVRQCTSGALCQSPECKALSMPVATLLQIVNTTALMTDASQQGSSWEFKRGHATQTVCVADLQYTGLASGGQNSLFADAGFLKWWSSVACSQRSALRLSPTYNKHL